jgi:hypothetical protein
MRRGVPPALRAEVSAWLLAHPDAPTTPALHLALARTHVRLGILYQVPAEFDRVIEELRRVPMSDEATLLGELARALRSHLTERRPPRVEVDPRVLKGLSNTSSSEAIRKVALLDAELLRLMHNGPEVGKLEGLVSIMNRITEASASCLTESLDLYSQWVWTGGPPRPKRVSRCPFVWRGT